MFGHFPIYYFMPDGTKTLTRPKDGDKFHQFDPATGTGVVWQWDDFLEQWHNVSSGAPNQHNTVTFPAMICPMDQDGLYDNDGMEDASCMKYPPPVKCECGATAVGSNRHSTWCIKFSPNL